MDDKTTKAAASEKAKALAAALSQIEKQFGKGSIMKLGKDSPVAEIEATSTGSLGLDIALGIGGVPKGRIIEVYGPESSGKTTLTLHVIAQAQKAGGDYLTSHEGTSTELNAIILTVPALSRVYQLSTCVRRPWPAFP